MAPFWQPFGAIMGVFWLAFSAYASLELRREPFHHYFDDLVLFLVLLLHIFDALLLKTHIIIASRLAPSMHPFSFPSSPLERASAVTRSEAVAWSRLRRRLGPKTTSEASFVPLSQLNTTGDLPVLGNIASTIVLSFLAVQVLLIMG